MEEPATDSNGAAVEVGLQGTVTHQPPKNKKTAVRRMTHLDVIQEDKQVFLDDSEEEDEREDGGDPTNGEDDNIAADPTATTGEEEQPQQQPRITLTQSTLRQIRRRSAITLMHNAFGASTIRLQNEMDMVRGKLSDSYQREGDAVLLHGYLHIQIIRAKNLRNKDGFRCLHHVLQCISTDLSDPYVTVHAGAHRLLKTRHIDNDLNPEWNENFYVPICHPIEKIEFRVKDRDGYSGELLGKSFLSVHELIQFADDDPENLDLSLMFGSNNAMDMSISNQDHMNASMGASSKKNRDVLMADISQSAPASSKRLLRTGVHKKVHLDNRPHHGSLEYFIDFIPKDLLHKLPKERGLLTEKSAVSMVVPGVYFPLRKNNRYRYYINADDHGNNPLVQYGVANKKTWQPHRFFKDVYDSICLAEHIVYIVGWSVDYTQSLLRGAEQTEALHTRKDGTTFSPFIGELLNQKANDGVVVNMLVWDDQTSNSLNRVGVVATMDEQLRTYFRGTKVNLRLVPMVGGNTNIMKKFRNAVYYTHHQKCVICDNPRKELVAYVGGIDLTYGRYDDGSYPLFKTLETDHKFDFHNACAEVNRTMGPREPWHDITSRVEGEGAFDVLKNFEERWIGQGGQATELVSLDQFGIVESNPDIGDQQQQQADTWHTQLFRSIDERTAKLKKNDYKANKFQETKGVNFNEEKKRKAGKRQTILEHILKTGKEKEQRFVAAGNPKTGDKAFTLERAELDIKRELRVDTSCHKALVHHIRNAQHSIYMESQYFLSSSFLWPEEQTGKCPNLVAAEITFKICEKIEAGERFAAYITLPMWPEGLPGATSVQNILAYQTFTMRTMYERIANSIARRRHKLLKDGTQGQIEEFKDVRPTDYLNFYCLAVREKAEEAGSIYDSGLLSRTRRHLVYTHSKMTIVDDAVTLIGSANINQRSLDGNRDSELLLGAWQPDHVATRASIPHGDVHGFRLYCFAHLAGTMDDAFREPSSLKCVRRLNAIAAENWIKYTQEEVCDMTGTIVPYPVKVGLDGSVEAATENGKFPDTNSPILGTTGTLPKFLTT